MCGLLPPVLFRRASACCPPSLLDVRGSPPPVVLGLPSAVPSLVIGLLSAPRLTVHARVLDSAAAAVARPFQVLGTLSRCVRAPTYSRDPRSALGRLEGPQQRRWANTHPLTDGGCAGDVPRILVAFCARPRGPLPAPLRKSAVRDPGLPCVGKLVRDERVTLLLGHVLLAPQRAFSLLRMYFLPDHSLIDFVGKAGSRGDGFDSSYECHLLR